MTGRPRACLRDTIFAGSPATISSAPTSKRAGVSLASSTTNEPSSPCDLPTRPTATVSGAFIKPLVDDLELHATLFARASGTDDRAQRACDASLPADHLAQILLRDMQAKDDRVVLVDALHPHLVGLVDELPRQILEQLRHSLLAQVPDLQQPVDRLGGLRTLAEPVLHLVLVELDQRRIVLRVVAPDDLDELAVARRARVGDHDAVHRVLLRPDTRQSHANCQTTTSWIFVVSCVCWILSLFAVPAVE